MGAGCSPAGRGVSRSVRRRPRDVGTQDVGGEGASRSRPSAPGPGPSRDTRHARSRPQGPETLPASKAQPQTQGQTGRGRPRPSPAFVLRGPQPSPHTRCPWGHTGTKAVGRAATPPPPTQGRRRPAPGPSEGPARGALREAIPHGGSGAGSGAGSASRVVGAAGRPLQVSGQQAAGSGHWLGDEGSAPPPGVTAGWAHSDHPTP